MNVLLINEPFVDDFCRTQRWAARTRGRVLRAPDWLAYATAVLRQDGFTPALYDFPAMHWGKDRLRELVRERRPDAVVLDSTTPSIYSDIDCARIVKEVSQAFVIMVGPHVSALPGETLTHAAGAVDAACIGEYDRTISDILRNRGTLSGVPGIAYWDGSAARVNSPRPLIEDLDSLPFPAWDQLDLTRYFDGGKLYPYIDVISGRGCPNQCVFCLWPQVMHGTHYRFRAPARVVDELEYDLKLCPAVRQGEFFFEDDTFTVHRDRAMEICDEILRRGLKITFSVNARADSADREMFRLMKRAGCRELLVGFESGSQEILDASRKRITIDQSRSFMALAKEASLCVHGCFVIGLPGETDETARKTIEFALSLGLDTVQFSGAVPFPGTAFFARAEQEGWLRCRQWDQWLGGGEQKSVVSYPHISQERIDQCVDEGLRRFYFRPAFMLRFLLSTRSFPDLYRKVRGAFNFISYTIDSARRVSRRITQRPNDRKVP